MNGTEIFPALDLLYCKCAPREGLGTDLLIEWKRQS